MIKQSKECYGCGLCASVCPKQCIKMEYDTNGFRYPTVDKEECINCSVCEKSCFISKDIPKSQCQKYFVARVRDEDVLKSSSSGGVFSSLASYVTEKSGVVYGAIFDDEFRVVHRSADNMSGVAKMRGSKYVQSDIGDVFAEVEKNLTDGRMVLFSGTPCQTDAVLKFLNSKGISIDNLILVDVICHGTCSNFVWRDYIAYITEKFGKIKNVNMRHKTDVYGYCMKIDTQSAEYVKQGGRDPYIKLFQQNLILRDSCFTCKYKSMDRASDITVGDFRNHNSKFSRFFDAKGVSSVIVNTKKGQDAFDAIKSKMEYEEVTEVEIFQENLAKKNFSNTKRNTFFADYEKMNFTRLLKKYTELGFKNNAVSKAKGIIKKMIKRKN